MRASFLRTECLIPFGLALRFKASFQNRTKPDISGRKQGGVRFSAEPNQKRETRNQKPWRPTRNEKPKTRNRAARTKPIQNPPVPHPKLTFFQSRWGKFCRSSAEPNEIE